MATIQNDLNSVVGKYMQVVDNAEIALTTAISKLDVIIGQMDPGPDKESAMAEYAILSRKLTYIKDKDSAWIQGKGVVRAPTDAEVKQTKTIAEKLKSVTASESYFGKILDFAGDVIKVVNDIFGTRA
jgi:hypothetical protein